MGDLGIYIHFPYCLQRCLYCDFATYVQGETISESEYFKLLHQEIDAKEHFFQPRPLKSIYFGGGTPSLADPLELKRILDHLDRLGFTRTLNTEVTLEINPATLDPRKIETLMSWGVNRFSVGVQTFHDPHLKKIGRKHSSFQTQETLTLLKSFHLNFSMDLLFSLPHQTMDHLRSDLDQFLEISPQHISPYILTIPSGNPLSQNRPSDEVQIEMFEMIRERLEPSGYVQYEISNYARPGKESQHNLLYWNDSDYWGLGLSSHSYKKRAEGDGDWGVRFWNPAQMPAYKDHVTGLSKVILEKPSELPNTLMEQLRWWESITDYIHTHLRTKDGLNWSRLEEKFGLLSSKDRVLCLLESGLIELAKRDLVFNDALRSSWSLTKEGQHLSNQVFERLTLTSGIANTI